MADPDRIQEIIEFATTDAYGEDEQMMGWSVAFADAVSLPVEARALGKRVQILQFDGEAGRGIRCEIEGQGIARRWVGIDALDIDSLPQGLQEVFEAYEAYEAGNY